MLILSIVMFFMHNTNQKYSQILPSSQKHRQTVLLLWTGLPCDRYESLAHNSSFLNACKQPFHIKKTAVLLSFRQIINDVLFISLIVLKIYILVLIYDPLPINMIKWLLYLFFAF